MSDKWNDMKWNVLRKWFNKRNDFIKIDEDDKEKGKKKENIIHQQIALLNI